MRPAQKNNRSRGRGNRKSGSGGGGNVVNRVYDSAGPEGKVRGTPQQIIEKYLSLARDAQTTGDRVVAENFLQHAEHYQRLLIQANAMQEQSRRESGDSADFDGDDTETTPMSSDRHAQPQHQPQHQPQPQQPQRQPQQPQHQPQQPQQPQRQPQPQPQGRPETAESAATDEIGGMTMIDSGEGSEDLLVVPEEITQSQPRRNGDGRRRRAKQPAGEARDSEQQIATEPQPHSES